MKKTISFVCKLYLLLMPFQLMPFFRPFRNTFSRVAAIDNCMFIMLIGLLLIMIYTRGTLLLRNELMRKAILLVFELIGISLLTSLVLLPVFGSLYGEDTITASLSTNIYYVLLAVTFFFNAHLFDFLTKEQIRKIMDFLCVFNLVIGFVQILIVSDVPIIGKFYDDLDYFDIFVDSGKMLLIGRICATRVEPANMGISICVFLLPYAMARLLHAKNKRKYLLYMVGLTVLCGYALSSAVLVSLLAAYMLFIILSSRKTGAGKFVILLLVLAMIGVLIISSGMIDNTEFGQKISYLLVEKTTNTSNLSSGYRYTTVVNDLVCFVRYPFSGIGNGNQGFLYNETMNSSLVSEAMRNNYQTVKAMSGANGVLSGGAFVPAFISGYGILGLVLLGIYINAVRKKLKEKRESLNYYYEWFCIGAITFLIVSTVAGSIEGNYIVMFVLSLPFAADPVLEEKEEVHSLAN
jgi:hypothetical protein